VRGLAGRNVIVTGGGSGIGAATVARLHEEGAATAAWDLTTPDAPDGSLGQAVDVTDADAVARALDEVRGAFGEVHGLVNCAGTLGGAHKLAAQPLDEVRRTFESNTHGALQVLQAVLPLMVEGGGGAIVNVASNAALRVEGRAPRRRPRCWPTHGRRRGSTAAGVSRSTRSAPATRGRR